MKKLSAVLIVFLMIFAMGCQNGETVQDNNTQPQSQTSSSQNANENSTASKQGTVQTQQNSQPQANASGQTTQTQAPSTTNKKTDAPAKAAFTILITKNKGSEEILKKVLEIKDNKTALSYLRDICSVVDEGGFIKSIDDLKSISSMDLTQEQKKAGIIGVDWFIYLNGEKTARGANDIVPKNGDIVNFDYKEWSYQDLAP